MAEYNGAASALAALMQSRRLSVEALSARTEITPAVLRRILSGAERHISTRNLFRLSRALGLPMAVLLKYFS